MRHGISQLPRQTDEATTKPSFKHYPIAYLHMDICEVRAGEGKAYLFVAVIRTSVCACPALNGSRRLSSLKRRCNSCRTGCTPCSQFAKRPGTESYKPHRFDVVCHRHGIEHRLIRPFHPWTNGQVEQMNRTIKEATIRSFHYATLGELSDHLKDYLWAYNSARPLRSLKGKTPMGFILDRWQDDPERFHEDPVHYFPRPYTLY